MDNALESKLSISDSEQLITSEITIPDLTVLTDTTRQNELQLSINTSFTNIDPGYWLGDTALTSDINGSFLLNTRDIDPTRMLVDFALDLAPSEITGFVLDSVNLVGNYHRDDLELSGNVGSPAVALRFAGLIESISDSQYFSIKSQIRNLNLAPLADDDSLRSDLNFDMNAIGNSFDPEKITMSADARMLGSSLFDLPLDTMFSRFMMQGENIEIDTLNFSAAFAQLTAVGSADLNGNTDLQARIALDDLSRLKPLTGMDKLNIPGEFKLNIAGPADNLAVEADAIFSGITIDSLAAIDSLTLTANLSVTEAGLSGVVNAALAHDDATTFPLNSLSLNSELSPETIGVQLAAYAEDLVDASARMDYFPLDSVPRLTIPEMEILLGNLSWQSSGETAEVLLGEEEFTIRNLTLDAQAPDLGAEAGIPGCGGCHSIGR